MTTTKNFAEVIRAKLLTDPELAKLVDIEHRISETIQEVYDDFADAIREAEQRGAERMREACANSAEHSIWAVGLTIAASIRALPLDDSPVEDSK